MAHRETQQVIQVPIHLSYRTFESMQELDWGFSLERIKPSIHYLRFRKGVGLNNYPITVHIHLKKVNHQQTQVTIHAEMFGPFDGGNLNASINKFILMFEKLVEIEKVRARPDIDAGRVCPTCFEAIPPGARFCPNDGTAIGRFCPQCSQPNAPAALFCSNCGTSLSENKAHA